MKLEVRNLSVVVGEERSLNMNWRAMGRGIIVSLLAVAIGGVALPASSVAQSDNEGPALEETPTDTGEGDSPVSDGNSPDSITIDTPAPDASEATPEPAGTPSTQGNSPDAFSIVKRLSAIATATASADKLGKDPSVIKPIGTPTPTPAPTPVTSDPPPWLPDSL